MLADALAHVGGTPRITGASFWTDAAVFGHAGTPSILFGASGAEENRRRAGVTEHGRIGPETGAGDARRPAHVRERVREHPRQLVIDRRFVGRPAEHRGPRTAKRRVLGT